MSHPVCSLSRSSHPSIACDGGETFIFILLTLSTFLHSSILHFSFFTFHTSLFTLHTSLFILHFSHFTLHTSLFTLHSSLLTFHFSLFMGTNRSAIFCSSSAPRIPPSWYSASSFTSHKSYSSLPAIIFFAASIAVIIL